MKTFNAAHLAKKPSEVFAAAREEGAIIQQKRTNGEVIEEFVLVAKDNIVPMFADINGKHEKLHIIGGIE